MRVLSRSMHANGSDGGDGSCQDRRHDGPARLGPTEAGSRVGQPRLLIVSESFLNSSASRVQYFSELRAGAVADRADNIVL